MMTVCTQVPVSLGVKRLTTGLVVKKILPV
jgi:hypothetical protein